MSPASKLYLTDRLAEGQPAIHQAQVPDIHTISSLALGGRHVVFFFFFCLFYIRARSIVYGVAMPRGGNVRVQELRREATSALEEQVEPSETHGSLRRCPRPAFADSGETEGKRRSWSMKRRGRRDWLEEREGESVCR